MKKQKILIAGGDMRQLFCGARLGREYDIWFAGFDEEALPDGVSVRRADLSGGEKYSCVVLPVPALDENGMIAAPLGGGTIDPAEISAALDDGAVIFAGKADQRLVELFPGADIVDYMEREELSLLNAIPTAEGAVRIALEELPVTLSGLSVLIVGMGRIGTALTGILRGFGADVTVAVRSAKAAAKVRIAGAKPVCTKNIGHDYKLVFNTAPELIFDAGLLEQFSTDTLFIDLASRPGGFDFDAAAALGRHVIWALGLPGKSAPITAGEIIAGTISGILSEGGGVHD